MTATIWTVTIVDFSDNSVSTWSCHSKQKALASLEEDYGADLPEMIEALANGRIYDDVDQLFTLTEAALI